MLYVKSNCEQNRTAKFGEHTYITFSPRHNNHFSNSVSKSPSYSNSKPVLRYWPPRGTNFLADPMDFRFLGLFFGLYGCV
jgi:hypothetical protein